MESVTVAQGPQAFAGWDSSVFMSWLRAMSDMMLSKADGAQMAPETLSNYGGLMHALTQAANELQERERNKN